MAIRITDANSYYTATWPYPYVAEFTVVYSALFYAGAYHPISFSATAYGSGNGNDSAVSQHASSGNNLNFAINSSTGGYTSLGAYPYSGTGQAGGTGRDTRWHTFGFAFRTFGANDGDQAEIHTYAPSGRVQGFRDYVSGAKNAWTLFCIGRNSWGTNFRGVNGIIGPVAIYNRVLLPHEFQFLYHYGDHRRVPGLRHYWAFDRSGNIPDEIGSITLTQNGTQGSVMTSPIWNRIPRNRVYSFFTADVILRPTGIAAKTKLAGAYTDIDESVLNPDGNWLTYRVSD